MVERFWPKPDMDVAPDGPFVRHSDYEAVQQELAEVRAERSRFESMMDDMVPIHADGSHVFIDGPGDVELDWGGELRARAEDAESRSAALDAQVKVMREAGAALANCAFNLKQKEWLSERERASLNEAQEAWDAAALLPLKEPERQGGAG